MHGDISKRVKMHINPTSGTNKLIIARSRKGKGTQGATVHSEMPPIWLHLNKASWALGITKQDQARGGHQAWQSLELGRLTQT